jgi:LmeA-like phospholipid-binding
VSGRTLFALLVLVLVVLAPYTILPPLLESIVARTVQDKVGLSRPPEVELASDPPLGMYVGSFSKARISVRGYEIGGLQTEYVALELDPFNLNMLRSATTGTLSTAQPLSGRLQVKLSEATDLRLAQAGIQAPPQSIELSQDQILSILSGQIPMGRPVS